MHSLEEDTYRVKKDGTHILYGIVAISGNILPSKTKIKKL